MSRPRDRQSAEGLLPRMEARPWADGKTVTYRYLTFEGKWKNLGTDKVDALRQVLDMLGQTDGYGSLAWVWERYAGIQAKPAKDGKPAVEGKPGCPRWEKLAAGSQADYRTASKPLLKVFGRMQISAITSVLVARYVHVERAATPRRADIEKTLLSNLFKHGIKLGVCEHNPTQVVEPHGSEPRTVLPLDAVLGRFLEWLNKQTPQRRVAAMMAEYAALAGNRQVEFRDLVWPQVDRAAGEIRIKRAKQRGKRRGEVIEIIKITPKLDALLGRLHEVRLERGVDCLYVFPTDENNAYSASGFKTMWGRVRAAAISAGVIQPAEKFTFHDLRAYYTTMHKRQNKVLPDLHANPATTARIYDRDLEKERKALG